MKIHIILGEKIENFLLTNSSKKIMINALDEAIELASVSIKNGSKFLFLPENCRGIFSNGKLYAPSSEEMAENREA